MNDRERLTEKLLDVMGVKVDTITKQELDTMRLFWAARRKGLETVCLAWMLDDF